MFESDSGMLSEGKVAQQCKPDYERLIKEAKGELKRTMDLLAAIKAYASPYFDCPVELRQGVGELTCKEWRLCARIENLIREQEAANK